MAGFGKAAANRPCRSGPDRPNGPGALTLQLARSKWAISMLSATAPRIAECLDRLVQRDLLGGLLNHYERLPMISLEMSGEWWSDSRSGGIAWIHPSQGSRPVARYGPRPEQ